MQTYSKIRFNYICVFSYFEQDESHVFQLVGQAKPHIMYLTGGDDLMPDIESLAVVPVIEDEESTCSFCSYLVLFTLDIPAVTSAVL